MTPAEIERLRDGAAKLGVDLDEPTIDRYAHYSELLTEWNRRLNLTRVPPEQYVDLHFLDSLAPLSVIELPANSRCIDVGTGAGFPGLPLKIARPDLEFVLLDATRKKLAFVDQVIAELGLTGSSTVHARAEEAGRLAAHRGRYDFAIARAVAPLERLAGWLIPLVKQRGTALALKGPDAEREMQAAEGALRQLHVSAERKRVNIPDTDLERSVVILQRRPK